MNSLSPTPMTPLPNSLGIAPRVRFIEHQGKQILFIDYSECDIHTLKAVADEMHSVISKQPLNSVLTLSDVTGTSFDSESIAVLKSKVAANSPYVRRAAVIGIMVCKA